jgi:signal transduction histidine kinase
MWYRRFRMVSGAERRDSKRYCPMLFDRWRQNRTMAVGKRAALGTGFSVITGLLVLSTALAYHIQESFSRRSVAIHRHYVQELEVVTSLRRLLYNAGIMARDYLLDPAPDRASAYSAQIADLRRLSKPLLAQLKESSTHPKSVEELESRVDQLWKALDGVTTRGREIGAYKWVQQEITPPRTAAGNILQGLETENHRALTESEEEFSASRAAAASNLLWLLGSSLLGAIGIAWFSLQYSDLLERQAAMRFEEVLKAKVELERLSNRLMEIQEEERTRLSRELHDEIVQNVAVLKIEITQALATLQGHPAREPLARARELADRTVGAVRNISLLLRPSLLDDLGLGPALQWQIDDFTRRTGVPCAYVEENLGESLPDAVNTCVYRVTQEALRNCEKHSRAQHVSVRVKQFAGGLSVEIEDDGVGFQNERRSPASLGVLGMRERAAALGGDLDMQSSDGQGTLVRLWLPNVESTQRGAALEVHT